ncbi:hypothetical protein NQZ68_000366 [Dissostichus eleginoides]|nr:hypothetical protein NQZ68_000366 [Dissostichus eleginoides]
MKRDKRRRERERQRCPGLAWHGTAKQGGLQRPQHAYISVQAECTPNLLHPYPQKHPPLLCSFSAPSLPPPSTSSQISARPLARPSFLSRSPSLSIVL